MPKAIAHTVNLSVTPTSTRWASWLKDESDIRRYMALIDHKRVNFSTKNQPYPL